MRHLPVTWAGKTTGILDGLRGSPLAAIRSGVTRLARSARFGANVAPQNGYAHPCTRPPGSRAGSPPCSIPLLRAVDPPCPCTGPACCSAALRRAIPLQRPADRLGIHAQFRRTIFDVDTSWFYALILPFAHPNGNLWEFRVSWVVGAKR